MLRMGETVTGHAGRYDHISARVLEETEAKGVVLIVHDGKLGFGMSVSVRPAAAGEVHVMLPSILRTVADAIERGTPPDGLRVTTKG